MILKEYFAKAKKEKWALGHFNFSTADQLKAIVEAAAEMKSPVIVGTTEDDAKFLGRQQAVALVRSWQDLGYPVFLNANHHTTWESVEEAIEEGYDMVVIDGSELEHEKNIKLTEKVASYTHDRNPDMIVEGMIKDAKMTAKFIEKTGVDQLGLNFEDIDTALENAKGQDFFLTLHKAFTLSDEQTRDAIERGITNVHIITAIRAAYHDALEKELAKADESDKPREFIKPAFEATKKLVKDKLELFGSVGKI